MSQAIYPEKLAAMLAKSSAGEKYLPSNGTEGDLFFACWCAHCQNDKAMREGCDLDECDDNELLAAIEPDAAERIAREAFRFALSGGHITDLYKQPERMKLREVLASMKGGA